jgi:hypothetical protein
MSAAAATASKLYQDYLVAHVRWSLQCAVSKSSRLPPEVLAMPGTSCAFTRKFVDALCSAPHCRLLQLGCKTASLAVAALVCNAHVHGVAMRLDADVDVDADADEDCEEYYAALTRHLGSGVGGAFSRWFVLHGNSVNTCVVAEMEDVPGDATVLVFDGGNQTFESHHSAIVDALPFLASHFVYVVQGCGRYVAARGAAEAGLRDANVTVTETFDALLDRDAGFRVYVCAKSLAER